VKIKSIIPNLFTLGNLFLGITGIILSFQTKLEWAGWCILGAAIFDFFDGFVARLLNAPSEIGKQLDSLCDLVSFGVLPGLILFHLISVTLGDYFTPVYERSLNHLCLSGIALLIPLFSAYRLAKFNTDKSQTTYFIGVPTPAVALFIASIVIFINMELNLNTYVPLNHKLLDYMKEIRKISMFDYHVSPFLFSTWTYLIIAVICSLLLVVPIRFIALKFKTLHWKDHIDKISLVIISVFLVVYFIFSHHSYAAFPLIFIAYLLISLLGNFKTIT